MKELHSSDVPKHEACGEIASLLFMNGMHALPGIDYTTESLRVGVDLRHDPFAYFRRKKSVYALYVRRTLLGQNTAELRTEIRRKRNDLLVQQQSNGSWNDRVAETIYRLYALHLLGDKGSDNTRRGTLWLLEDGEEPLQHKCCDGARYDGLFFRLSPRDRKELKQRRDLVVSPSNVGLMKTSAALYFATLFGLEEHERVENAMRTLALVGEQRKGQWCAVAGCSNILRAFLNHPRFAGSAVSRAAMQKMEQIQNGDGNWMGTPHFYHALNAVSYSNHRSARRQVEHAMPRVLRAQNADGSWGRTQREWQSLLVLDALHRQNLLDR